MSRLKNPTVVAITLSFIVLSVYLVSSLLSATTCVNVGGNGEASNKIDLISEYIDLNCPHNARNAIDSLHRLKKADIIPTVIDTFKPKLDVSITWKPAPGEEIEANLGNTIPVDKTQDPPEITFDVISSRWSFFFSHAGPQPQLTLIVTDPDAPSRAEPSNSEFCHWITTRVQRMDSNSEGMGDEVWMWRDVMSYRPPGPPERTGKHRYVFVMLAPLNETMEELHLVAPKERRRWGFEGHEGDRIGVREWAAEMGLGAVGANFIYEQNEVQ